MSPRAMMPEILAAVEGIAGTGSHGRRPHRYHGRSTIRTSRSASSGRPPFAAPGRHRPRSLDHRSDLARRSNLTVQDRPTRRPNPAIAASRSREVARAVIENTVPGSSPSDCLLAALVPVLGSRHARHPSARGFLRLDETVYDTIAARCRHVAPVRPDHHRRHRRKQPVDVRPMAVAARPCRRAHRAIARGRRGRDGARHNLGGTRSFRAVGSAIQIRPRPTDTDRSWPGRSQEGAGDRARIRDDIRRGAPNRPRRASSHPIGIAVVSNRPATRAARRSSRHRCRLQSAGARRSRAASGFLNAAPDADGILRRVPLVVELDGRLYPSLAFAAVSNGHRCAQRRAARLDGERCRFSSMDDGTCRSTARSNLLPRYRGKKRTFLYVSAADVMSGGASPEALRDKIVFVGTTALGTREVVATPLDTCLPAWKYRRPSPTICCSGISSRDPRCGSILEVAAVLVRSAIAVLVCVDRCRRLAARRRRRRAPSGAGPRGCSRLGGLFISPLFADYRCRWPLVAVMTFAKFTVRAQAR